MRAPLSDAAFASAADWRYCRDLLRGGSRTFHAASRLLPRRIREPAVALYAFCRVADDRMDLDAGRETALAELRDRLRGIYDGRPHPVPCDRALADVVRCFALPVEIPAALLEGFAWDAAGRQYETPEDLCGYAARVAGTVGVMMTILMNRRSPEALAAACDLGIAMQLTNIARDVGEDALAGRLYLPLRWLRDEGIEPAAFLARPRYTESLGRVIARLLDVADDYYAQGHKGIALLPFDCRPAILAAHSLYGEIGREVARRGGDSVSARAVVPAGRKLRVLAGLTMPGQWSRRPRRAAVPAEGRGLLAAIGGDAVRHDAIRLDWSGLRPSLRRRIDERVAWVVDLFDALERRDRERAATLTR